MAHFASLVCLLLIPSTLPFSSPLQGRAVHSHVKTRLYSTNTTVPDVLSSPSLKQQSSKQQWITCSSTKELTHAIRNLVRPGDCVAELGSQLREVSTAICESVQTQHDKESGGGAILVDTVRKFPSSKATATSKGPTKNAESSRTRAMRREGAELDFYPQCATFYEIERLDDWRQAFFGKATSTTASQSTTINNYDVLVLDVSSIVGNDLEWTTLSIIREFISMNEKECRVVLVKSLSLNQWASRIIHGRRWCLQGGAPKPDPRKTSPISKDETPALSPCHVVATVGVPEYRDTIPYTVRPGDAVLEIGCHLGTSTALIHDACIGSGDMGGYSIGVDIGSKIIQGAQGRHRHIHFAVGDAWRTAALLRTQQEFLTDQATLAAADPTSPASINSRTGFDVVYVDVGGLSGQDGLIESLSLISALANALEPRCIVIKSLCMRRLSSVLVPYWKLQQQSKDR